MKASSILAAVLIAISGRAYAADIADLQTYKVSDIKAVVPEVVVPSNLEKRTLPVRADLTAADFGVFSLGSINYSGSDFEGRTGAAGDAHFDSFSLGVKEPGGAATLIVGGSADLRDGSVWRGGVIAGGRVRAVRVGLHGVATEGARIGTALEAVSRELLSASDRLAALPYTACALWDEGLLLAARPGTPRTVLSIAAARLSRAGVVTLNLPAGTTLVVNVTGASASISNADFRLEGSGHAVFNFHCARTLTIGGVAIPGVVLAPRATTRFFSGRIDGRLYTGDLSGNGQVNETGITALPDALAGLPDCGCAL